MTDDNLFAVTVDQDFPVPAPALWRAITDPDCMRQWYFDNIPDFRPEVGFATRFTVQVEERQFPHYWHILKVEPGKSLTYSWHYDGYPGSAEVTFMVAETEDGSRLNLHFQVVEPFPDNIPEFTRDACQGGWDYFIGVSLPGYLAR